MNTVVEKHELCRSCQAPVVWAEMPSGKLSLFNAKAETRYILHPGEDGVLRAEPQATYTSHFATCPQAADWRRP